MKLYDYHRLLDCVIYVKGKEKWNDELLWRLCQLKNYYLKCCATQYHAWFIFIYFASVCGYYLEVCHHCQSFFIYTFLHWIVKKKQFVKYCRIYIFEVYISMMMIETEKKIHIFLSKPTYPIELYIYISSIQVITLIKHNTAS